MKARTDFADGKARCGWVDESDIYRDYHDEEWGRPVADERALFEQLCLEGFQAGLSWRTILNKREAFRRGFARFDPKKVARYTEADVERLLADAGIVRHRGKIEAVINTARQLLEMHTRGESLAQLTWAYAHAPRDPAAAFEVRATSAQATALSKALKKLGWSFVGPTTVYAFMQSVGMVNDHHPDCHACAPCDRERAAFAPPA
ncbi:MAG: DNA-3-methyladenine glycosylase I [Bordetella sp.]|nr:DNA-3-methyladenine glycosylase I [Bordetella sp.]